MTRQPVSSDPDNTASLETAMAAVAFAMSDASRVRMLCALMDGRAWTATELSCVADIAASTASAHLARLVSGRLVVCLSQGRHRYYRLTGHDVASLIETMMGVSWTRITPPESRTPVGLRKARTCYDHLAGEVAVEIYAFMVRERWISEAGDSLTDAGKKQLSALGVVTDPHTRRKACCGCLDWSERRFHAGGDLGAAMLSGWEQKGWLTRTPGYREVTFTREGESALWRIFQINLRG